MLVAKPIADKNNIILLSPASTAPSLAEEDNIYRFMPNDIQQADAITTLLQEENALLLIPVYRNDNYGIDFSNQLKETDKIVVTNGFSYKTEECDINTLVKNLSEGVNLLHNKNIELNQVAVVTIGFGEVVDILKEANKYENLKKIKWIGTDGIALNNELCSNTDVIQFANTVNFRASAFGVDQTTYYDDITKQLTEKLGRRPDTESLITYDMVWILASLYEKQGMNTDYDALKENIVEISKLNPGASGWMILDKNGDRKYSIYDFWTVQDSSWVYYAKYRRDPGQAGYIVYK